MHVCFVILSLDVFKGGNHLPLLGSVPGVRFTVLTNSVKPRDAVLPQNVRVECLHERLGPYYYGIADTLFARAVLRRYPPAHSFWKQFDVIHLNQVLGRRFLALRDTGVPVLYAIHHPVSADKDVSLAESPFFSGLRWRMKYAFLLRGQRLLAKGMPTLMTVSRSMADRLSREFSRNPSDIRVVQNGVDGAMFHSAEHSDQDTFAAIAIGSLLHPRKGFPYLLSVYRELAAHGWKIADVGRRSASQQAALADIPGLTAYGTVDHEAMLSLLQRSSVLLSCSLFEGFGLSLIEALACGKPSIAFAVGAVPEVLTPVDPTLLVPPRDTAAMVLRVERFLALSSQERSSFARRYREAALRLYPLEGSGKALARVYASLAHSPALDIAAE